MHAVNNATTSEYLIASDNSAFGVSFSVSTLFDTRDYRTAFHPNILINVKLKVIDVHHRS